VSLPSILQQIHARTTDTLATRKRLLPLPDLRAQIADKEFSPRPFLKSLTETDEIAIIAEIKPASPSTGQIIETVDITAFAQNYESGGARAISVLTDPDFFGGELNNLALARQASTLPLLRKDFLFDPWQLYETKLAVADALLLIVSLLEKPQLQELLALARELALDVLVECHTPQEMELALQANAPLLGVNTRNLHDFSKDLSLLEQARKVVPEETPWVAESGLHTHTDLTWAAQCGASAALIGTALMQSPDPRAKLLALRGVQDV